VTPLARSSPHRSARAELTPVTPRPRTVFRPSTARPVRIGIPGSGPCSSWLPEMPELGLTERHQSRRPNLGAGCFITPAHGFAAVARSHHLQRPWPGIAFFLYRQGRTSIWAQKTSGPSRLDQRAACCASYLRSPIEPRSSLYKRSSLSSLPCPATARPDGQSLVVRFGIPKNRSSLLKFNRHEEEDRLLYFAGDYQPNKPAGAGTPQSDVDVCFNKKKNGNIAVLSNRV